MINTHEERLPGMTVDDKRLWLKKHGHSTGGGYDPAQGYHVIWETHGGMRFKGVGRKSDEVDANLFRVVYETLLLTCR